EAKAHAVHATALVRLGAIGAGEAALDRALAAARHARDHRRAHAVLAGATAPAPPPAAAPPSLPAARPAALWGPSPVPRASGRCLDVVRVLRIAQAAPAVEAGALRCQAVPQGSRGRARAGRGCGRGGGAPLPGRARGASRTGGGGAPHDRVVPPHGGGARPHAGRV